MPLEAKHHDILKIIVEAYLSEGKAVGSKLVSSRTSQGLSSASVRNYMKELEDLGMLYSLHTSAGRLPTSQGLRYYLDNCLKTRPLSTENIDLIESYFRQSSRMGLNIIRETTKILTRCSNYTAIVTEPEVTRISCNHIEYIPLTQRKMMLFVVTDLGMIYKKMLEINFEMTSLEVERINRFIDDHFRQMTLSQIRRQVREMMKNDIRTYDSLAQRALMLTEMILENIHEEPQIHIEGTFRFLENLKSVTIEQLRNLLHTFEEKKILLELLDKSLEANGVGVTIGSESDIPQLSPLSFVVSSYTYKGRNLGTLGLVGPWNMPYEWIVSLVDVVSDKFSDYLAKQ